MNATTELTFPEWLNTLDDLVLSSNGTSLYDLPELPYAPAYERELSPQEFYETVLADHLEREQHVS